MAWVIYDNVTGRLVSTAESESSVADPLPRGLVKAEVQGPIDFRVVMWDPAQKALVPRPPKEDPVEDLRAKDPTTWTSADNARAIRALLDRL